MTGVRAGLTTLRRDVLLSLGPAEGLCVHAISYQWPQDKDSNLNYRNQSPESCQLNDPGLLVKYSMPKVLRHHVIQVRMRDAVAHMSCNHQSYSQNDCAREDRLALNPTIRGLGEQFSCRRELLVGDNSEEHDEPRPCAWPQHID